MTCRDVTSRDVPCGGQAAQLNRRQRQRLHFNSLTLLTRGVAQEHVGPHLVSCLHRSTSSSRVVVGRRGKGRRARIPTEVSFLYRGPGKC